MGKVKGLLVAFGIGGFGLLLLGNPLASPNYLATLGTIELLGALLIVAGLAIGAIVLGSGSTFVNGSGNSWGNTTHNNFYQGDAPKSVKKHMNRE